MTRSPAEIIREYGPFPGTDRVHGVTHDGRHVWFAAGGKLVAFDPASGRTLRSIDVAAHAGTAYYYSVMNCWPRGVARSSAGSRGSAAAGASAPPRGAGAGSRSRPGCAARGAPDDPRGR